MQGERTYTANMLACLPRIVWLLALAAPAWGQVTISSIQSSLVGASSPKNVQGITSGAQLPGNGFTMWINGSFPNAAAGTNVQWFNPNTGVTFNTSTNPNPALNQLQVFIPENLYLIPVGSTQTVQITVTQGASQGTGQFLSTSHWSSPHLRCRLPRQTYLTARRLQTAELRHTPLHRSSERCPTD